MTDNIDHKAILKKLAEEAEDFATEDLDQLLSDAKEDSSDFLRSVAEHTQTILASRAAGEISTDEMEELMDDIVDLGSMQVDMLEVEVKVRADKLINGLRELVLNSLIEALK